MNAQIKNECIATLESLKDVVSNHDGAIGQINGLINRLKADDSGCDHTRQVPPDPTPAPVEEIVEHEAPTLHFRKPKHR